MNINMIDKIFNHHNTQELNYIIITLYNGETYKFYYESIKAIDIDIDTRTLYITYKDFSNNTTIDYFSSSRIQHIEINKEDFKKSENEDNSCVSYIINNNDFERWEW